MLRSLVLILLLVNAAFFAWSQGWLDSVVGVQPQAQHDPQRLKAQVHTDKLLIVPPEPAQAASAASSPALPASAASAPASATLPATPSPTVDTAAASSPAAEPAICLEAGPFNAPEFTKVETSLRPLLAAKAWRSDTVAVQGLWMVYMGPYGDAEQLARKQTELQRIKGLSFDEVHTPANLAQGLSLGRFAHKADAEAALNTFKLRGIRTARIVSLRQPLDVQVVRVPQATASMQAALSGLKLPQGKGFSACRP